MKKYTLDGTFGFHILLQGNLLPCDGVNDLWLDRTSKSFWQDGFQQSLSMPTPAALPEYRVSKKIDRDSNSQSWTAQIKFISQKVELFLCLMWSATKVPLLLAIRYSLGKDSLRDMSPHHTSSQNLTLVPSPTSNLMNVENLAQPHCIYFQGLTPYGPLEGFVHQPPSIEPDFTSTTCLINDSLSNPNLQSHFPKKLHYWLLTFLTVSLPFW